MADTPLRERLAAATEGNEWGVFLVALGALFLAASSVLAEDGLDGPLWALLVAGISVLVLASVAYQVIR